MQENYKLDLFMETSAKDGSNVYGNLIGEIDSY